MKRLSELLGSEHRVLARLIEHLIEVEERRLDRRRAYTSMFDFCVRRLGLSEGEAYRRITAARLVRRFPHILEKIERRQIHLSALVLLRDHLTDENHEELVALACGRRKRDLQHLLACRFPQPDAPGRIRKLPGTGPEASSGTMAGAESHAEAFSECGDAGSAVSSADPMADDRRAMTARVPTTAPRAVVEVLSESRYKLQLTIDAAVREKLERAIRLMSHGNPTGDLATVISRALDLLVADLERAKLAKAARPHPPPARPAAKKTKPGYVRRHVRRAVFARDGEQCTFVDEQGQRCPARSFLELDHIQPRALGGTDEIENLRVRCRMHNQLHAEEVFGREHVERKIHLSQRKSIGRTSAGKEAGGEPQSVDVRARTGDGARTPSDELATEDEGGPPT